MAIYFHDITFCPPDTMYNLYILISLTFNLVPTDEIPDLCKVKKFGQQTLEQTTSDKGKCVSLKKHLVTGCAGICGSSVKATLGSDTFVPECKCCQPSNVRKFDVTLKCENGGNVRSSFYEILSCSCATTRCDSSFNVNRQRDVSDVNSKKSLLRSIEIMPEMDDDTARRQRRSLLNDLALVHAKKKRR